MDAPTPTPAPPLSLKLTAALRSRRAKRIGLAALALLALYTLLGFFALPPLVQNTGARLMGEQLGRPVTIGRVATNPFLLRLEVDDLHIGGREEGEAFVDVGHLMARLSWSSLTRFVPVIAEARIETPRVRIVRLDAERFNFSDLAAPAAEPAPEPETSASDVVIERFSLAGGALSYADRPARAEIALADLAVDLENFSLLGAEPAGFALSGALASGGALKAEGKLSLAEAWAEAALGIDALALPVVQPYLAEATPARLTAGTASATASARAAWSGETFALTLADGALDLRGVNIALPGAEAPTLALARADATLTRFDLAARSIEIGKIAIEGLSAEAARNAEGAIDLAALAPPAEAAGAEAAPSPAWRYRIGEIALTGGRAAFTDRTLPTPAKIEAAPVALTLKNLTEDAARPLPLTFSATLNGQGALGLEGALTLDPFKIELRLSGERIDLTPFSPYAAGALNAEIARAALNARGDLAIEPAGESVRAAYRGDLELANVRVINRASSSPFAGWRSLAAQDLAASYDPDAGAAVDVGRVTFSNFYGRVLLDEQGQLHLHDILAKGGAEAPRAVSLPAEAPADAPPLRLRVGRLDLQNGQVTYTDNFIQPHYTAELTAINGGIGAFGTETAKPAPVDVAARLTANGPITIKGNVNPLAEKPSLDLRAVAKEIQLTNLTGYSTKYTGYPITRGKLNVDLHYRLADDRLRADNRILIDQLTFGPRVQNDTATDLPVQLAITLLKNAKGQIDVDIPVSGSLNDPQFDIGGLIWNAVGNLLMKAVTSPFTLLANALGLAGGGEDLGYVEFAAGSAVLPEAGQEKLETIAKLLAEKPSLNLNLIGRTDPDVDAPALREAHVKQLVVRQKIREMRDQGWRPDEASLTVRDAEYPRLLAEVYAAARRSGSLADTPANAGVTEMEQALAETAATDAAAYTRLAQARAEAVRAHLATKLPAPRLFILAPKLDPQGITDDGATTRVDFSVN